VRYYDSKLDVVKRVLLGEKCVCDIEKKEKKEHERKLYQVYPYTMDNG
jgi:hypothetical protein